MKNILVTGGAGYVGSHTCKALAEAGYRPVTVDNLTTGHDWAVRWGPLEKVDIRQSDRLIEIIRDHHISAVVHFAALSLVGQSFTDPGHYYDVNLGGTLSLLTAMQATDVRQIVFSSSCAVYGIPESLPIKESESLKPINPYGRTKAATEALLGDFAMAHGFRVAALRYFNAAGASPEDGIGEAHDPETHLIPLVIETALGNRPAIDVYGDDYATADGTCLRDYIHVNDLAQAHVAALRYLENQDGFHAFNLGNGKAYSVLEVISAVERQLGRPVTKRVTARRQGDPASLYADAGKASRALGWQPAQSALDQIVASAARWHEGNRNRTGRRKAS
jgi:UDP-arabinose 4-epimerase